MTTLNNDELRAGYVKVELDYAPIDDELKLTDFDVLELAIADALRVRNKLPIDKNLFDGGCLCHTYPKNSDSACGNHARMLGDIRNVKKLFATHDQQLLEAILSGADYGVCTGGEWSNEKKQFVCGHNHSGIVPVEHIKSVFNKEGE